MTSWCKNEALELAIAPDIPAPPRYCIFCRCKLSQGNSANTCRSALCSRLKAVLNVHGVTFLKTSQVQQINTRIGRRFKITGSARPKKGTREKRVVLDLATSSVYIQKKGQAP
jgi:hypothetical protein